MFQGQVLARMLQAPNTTLVDETSDRRVGETEGTEKETGMATEKEMMAKAKAKAKAKARLRKVEVRRSCEGVLGLDRWS